MIQLFPRPKDKLKAIMILEPVKIIFHIIELKFSLSCFFLFKKLISMTCQQARNILAAFFIPEDRLEALEYVKRYLKKKKNLFS